MQSVAASPAPDALATGAPVLEVADVAHSYGGVQAVNGVSFSVQAGTFVGLIGPNGAGKTTLLDCISGAVTGYRGSVKFLGQDITHWELSKVAKLGLIRTFQTSRVFGRLTVLSNLMSGPQRNPAEGLLGALLGRGRDFEGEALEESLALLRRFDLQDVTQNYGADLSGGQRRLTELCRTLMAKPRMLLLDEPFAGVSPTNRARLASQLRALCQDEGIPVLMIEHRLELVEQLCERIVVMAEGRVIAEGSMGELRKNPAVVAAYLGDVPTHGA